MRRLRLVHWKEEEAEERATRLRSLGYQVDASMLGPAQMRGLRDDPPDVVVIDLSRLPSQGRDIGLSLRRFRETRHVPLVFVSGHPDKVAPIRKLLPDATYSLWDCIGPAIEGAVADPPSDPVVHDSAFVAYEGRPLTQKLGIKEGMVVALVDAPEGFEPLLDPLPDGAVALRGLNPEAGLTLWFVRAQADLEARIVEMGTCAEAGALWIVWPKKASGVKSDLSQNVVRRIGLDSGLVDYKICSVDATWSGLLFTVRK
jgi:hypothetical protein